MRAALKNLIDNHLAVGKVKGPSKEVLDAIIETSNGDIRGAIMALQFSSTLTSGKVKKGATTYVKRQPLILETKYSQIASNHKERTSPCLVSSSRQSFV